MNIFNKDICHYIMRYVHVDMLLECYIIFSRIGLPYDLKYYVMENITKIKKGDAVIYGYPAHRYSKPCAVAFIAHNVDYPAMYIEGLTVWCRFGRIHRDGDKPAVEYWDGKKIWYKDGHVHRDGDKPAIESRGYIAWYYYGCLHRPNNKPAVIYPLWGRREWYSYGQLYHMDGLLPCVIRRVVIDRRLIRRRLL